MVYVIIIITNDGSDYIPAVFDYAYFNDKIVHVDNVDNGLKCGCICPECGDKLIAHNNGKIVDTTNFKEPDGESRINDIYQELLY